MLNARLYDMWTGICICCQTPMSGIIITASPDVNTNNLGQARLTDVDIGFCGHFGVISSASGTINTNNLGTARLGDTVSGCTIGTICTSSSDVDSGG